MAMSKKKKYLIIIPIAIILIVCISCGIYFAIYYHCQDSTALDNTASVSVIECDKYYFFDGPGEETAFIFYPGGKVESKAYADLMKKIAGSGVDCFLVKMPLNFALIGINRADKIIANNDYNNWFIGGHSLGGVAAAQYANKNESKIDGLVLLAAWSTKDLSKTSLKVLSMYGTNDGVLNIDKVNKNANNLPSGTITFIIEGGNHAQFGCYGDQKGDNGATISGEEQRTLAANKIIELVSQI